jgi:hypothetical protein
VSKKAKLQEAENVPVGENDPDPRTNEPAAEWFLIDQLPEWNNNPRDSDKSAPAIANSVIRLGWGDPLLGWIGPEGQRRLIAGHGRKKAVAILLRKWHAASVKQREKWHPGAVRVMETGLVPVRFRSDLSEHEANLLALADNETNRIAPWIKSALNGVLDGFSLEDQAIAGFTPDEDKSEASEIEELDLSDAKAEFYMSVSGPLEGMLRTVQLLREHLSKIQGVTVDVTTTEV